MPDFHKGQYSTAKLTLNELGVLTLRMHFRDEPDKPLRWGGKAHQELPEILDAIGSDPAVKVVVITGTGDFFMTPSVPAIETLGRGEVGATDQLRLIQEGREALSLAEWLNVTHYDDGIRVSCLCPQGVRTGLTPDCAGIAEMNGLMEPEDIAEVVLDTTRKERFLALPHPDVEEYFRRKGNDYDRWLKGMGRLQAEMGSTAMPDAPEYWDKS